MNSSTEKVIPFLLGVDLMKKGYECTGEYTLEGYTSSPELCSAICAPPSPIFVYGSCNAYGCRCKCPRHTENGFCIGYRKISTYDVYSKRLGMDD